MVNAKAPLSFGQRRQQRKLVIPVRLVLSLLVVLTIAFQSFLLARHDTMSNQPQSEPQPKSQPKSHPELQRKASKTIILSPQESYQNKEVAPREHTKALPKWIRDYIEWHHETLIKYPGKELFTNPDAPNVILRVCLGLCGGLHDRLGQLPWDLYLANQTKRIFFIKWDRPRALENFLMPNEINWTFPIPNDFKAMKEVRKYKELFENFLDDHPETEFWKESLDYSLKRATTGEFKDIKVLRHRILGHLDEKYLEARLRKLGETDMLHWSTSFGHIFHAFFKPSRDVQESLNAVYKELNMLPGQYSAVHCRVRHPKATPSNIYVKGKSNAHPADKTGLPWYGDNKDFAVAIATKAVYCARTLVDNNEEPIYFFADSNDLVRFIAHELKDSEFLAQNATIIRKNKFDRKALKAVKPMTILAREASEENAHIDRQKGRPPEAYFATFVDFYLAMNARCVTYGIGYYALFATKISATECKLVYQEEEWGGREGSKQARVCSEETYKYLL